MPSLGGVIPRKRVGCISPEKRKWILTTFLQEIPKDGDYPYREYEGCCKCYNIPLHPYPLQEDGYQYGEYGPQSGLQAFASYRYGTQNTVVSDQSGVKCCIIHAGNQRYTDGNGGGQDDVKGIDPGIDTYGQQKKQSRPYRIPLKHHLSDVEAEGSRQIGRGCDTGCCAGQQ